MAIYDIFSKRRKRERGDVPDVYKYDKIPEPLRAQIIHILRDTLGGRREFENYEGVNGAYQHIFNTLCREYGKFRLVQNEREDALSQVFAFILNESDVERFLDAIELTFACVDSSSRSYRYMHLPNSEQRADDAIAELNARFREHGIGYEYSNAEIIRIDSQLLHAEVVKPALLLLQDKRFSGAQNEFLKAHEHYRHGRAKEALAECLKAIESTIKAICKQRGWAIDSNATSKALIGACFDNGLVPAFWQTHFASLRSMLESSVPTGRNKLGGHGQGSEVVEVPLHLVSYVLHMTASTIVFLVEANKAHK